MRKKPTRASTTRTLPNLSSLFARGPQQIPERGPARFVSRRPFRFAPPASRNQRARLPCRPLSLPPPRHRTGRGIVPDRSLALPQILSALLSLVRVPEAGHPIV